MGTLVTMIVTLVLMVRMLESSQLSVERLKSKLEKQQLQRLSEREEELRSATFTKVLTLCFSLF